MELGLLSVVGLDVPFGLVLRLGLVSELYKWLFYLATVSVTLSQHKHVKNNLGRGVSGQPKKNQGYATG